MLALRFRQRLLSIAALAAVGVAFVALPARADDAAASVKTAQAKRTTTSLNDTGSSLLGGIPSSRQGAGYANGFVYVPGPQSQLNLGGRVNVGKSHVYVPYYGNMTGDPTHPTWQGAAGIAYGFRTWDISVVNGGFGNTPAPPIPGADANKTNPSLSLSVRF
jgi:hypothetical protein